jgi:outer membrane biogenesis lipoprotein LolB
MARLAVFWLVAVVGIFAQTKPASVAGTTWTGTDSDGDYYEYHFQPDGRLHYKSPSGSFANGTWKQDGDNIYFEMNKRFSEHKGTIKGDRMEGEAWNTKGHRWTWVADKKGVETNSGGVAGTTWAGTDSDGDYYEFHFQPDGSLHYKSPSGFYTNGTWKQDGDGIYFEMNRRFAEHKGTIKGNRMEGEAWNTKGHRWTWVVDKK